jgi:hypothetical protein
MTTDKRRRLVSIELDMPYVTLATHLIATVVLAASAMTVAWVFLFTPAAGTTTTHAHHTAATQ